LSKLLPDEPIEPHSSDDEQRETVNIETYTSKPEVKSVFDCQEVTSSGFMHPRSVQLYSLACGWLLSLHYDPMTEVHNLFGPKAAVY